MNFYEIMKVGRCTPKEQDKAAWYLAMLRAKTIYEELRTTPAEQPQGGEG